MVDCKHLQPTAARPIKRPTQNNSWAWKLKTEDLLELTRGDRGLALDSVSALVANCNVTGTFAAATLGRHFPFGRCL